jgi:hypothetical protein
MYQPHEELGTEISGIGVMYEPHKMQAPVHDKTKKVVPLSSGTRMEHHDSRSGESSKEGGSVSSHAVSEGGGVDGKVGKGGDTHGVEEDVKKTNVIEGRMQECSFFMAMIHGRLPATILRILAFPQLGEEVRQSNRRLPVWAQSASTKRNNRARRRNTKSASRSMASTRANTRVSKCPSRQVQGTDYATPTLLYSTLLSLKFSPDAAICDVCKKLSPQPSHTHSPSLTQFSLSPVPDLVKARYGTFMVNPWDMYISSSILAYGEWSEDEVPRIRTMMYTFSACECDVRQACTRTICVLPRLISGVA